MELLELNIKNYKSLGDVTFKPTNLSAVIGANASGKSNFANAISFLSEVYSYGLETAIRRKGGYENIALRRSNRSVSAVEFSFIIKVEKSSHDESFKSLRNVKEDVLEHYYIKHSFSFKTDKRNIKAEFIVEKEELYVYPDYKNQESDKALLSYVRLRNNIKNLYVNENIMKKIPSLDLIGNLIKQEYFLNSIADDLQKLIVSNPIFGIFDNITKNVGNWAVYQLNPNQVRLPGVPTPNPSMDIYGGNMPAIIDWLKTNEKDNWDSVLSTMQTILPNLTDITIDYLHNRTLGIFFQEEGLGRPWNSDEVSDGTILTLSILCSVYDPRKTLIVIEEPENSLHTWILRNIIDAFKKVSKYKNVIITTHSTTLIDLLNPEQIWCIWKEGYRTHLDKITFLEPSLLKNWEKGDYKISDFLDSGLMPQAVPGGIL